MNVLADAKKVEVTVDIKSKIPSLFSQQLSDSGPASMLAGVMMGPTAAPIGGISAVTNGVLL